jgi:hypothetical protein
MKVSRDEFLTRPYVLTADDLTKLCGSLGSSVDKILFKVECADKLEREFPSLEELLRFENPPKKDIQSLRIIARSKEETFTLIKFDKSPIRNIYVLVESNEESVINISDSLEERLAAMKPWYGFLAHLKIWLLINLVLFLLFIGIFLPKLIRATDFSKLSAPFYALAIIAVIAGAYLGVISTNKYQVVFPMGVFAIGQGVKRHKDKELIRTTVIIAFFISLVSSIIASLILM